MKRVNPNRSVALIPSGTWRRLRDYRTRVAFDVYYRAAIRSIAWLSFAIAQRDER